MSTILKSVTYDGEVMSLYRVSRLTGIPKRTLETRYNKGLRPPELVATARASLNEVNREARRMNAEDRARAERQKAKQRQRVVKQAATVELKERLRSEIQQIRWTP